MWILLACFVTGCVSVPGYKTKFACEVAREGVVRSLNVDQGASKSACFKID